MRLAFVDDDYGEIKKLTTMIDKELQGTVYSSCTKQLFSTGETFLSVWKPGMYDIVFLDIFMDQLTGVDVARQIRKTDASVKIIFCTTSNEFASESYCVDASFYLLKPFSQNMCARPFGRLKVTPWYKNLLRLILVFHFLLLFLMTENYTFAILFMANILITKSLFTPNPITIFHSVCLSETS